MLLRFYWLSLLMAASLSLVGQQRQAEKLLDERDYEAAMLAFERALAEADQVWERDLAMLGKAKVLANPAYAATDPMTAYRTVQDLIVERNQLSVDEGEMREKKLSLQDIQRVARSIENRQLRELKKSPNLPAIAEFVENYSLLPQRKQLEVAELRNSLSVDSLRKLSSYAATQSLVNQYDLYDWLPAGSGLTDTVLNRFIREYGWSDYERYARENPKSIYVVNDEISTLEGILEANDLEAAVDYLEKRNNTPFGYRIFGAMADIALVEAKADVLIRWLSFYGRNDARWLDVYEHLLTTVTEADPMDINLLNRAWSLENEQLKAADRTRILDWLTPRVTAYLASGSRTADEIEYLAELIDPERKNQMVRKMQLSGLQQALGSEAGMRAYLKSSPGSVIEAETRMALAALEEEQRLQAAAEKAEQERLKKERELAEDRLTGRQYASQEEWRGAQRLRIARGEAPEPYRLPETINTDRTEFKGNETTDGKILYFTREAFGEDIYASRKQDDGSWGKAELVGDVSTPGGNESIQLVTVDGTEMLFFNNGLFYTSQKSATGWQRPKPLPKTINGEAWQADAWISANNRSFFFVRKTDQDLDIFVSLRGADGKWAAAKRLPATINSSGRDRSPVLASDLTTLYFTSNGHEGAGESDIFVSERLDDTYLNWSEPKNLGTWINTPGDEWVIRLSPDGERFYYSSTYRKSSDLFEIFLPESVRPKAVIILAGKVENIEGDGIGTVIVWTDLETGAVLQETRTDPADGSWIATLPGFKRGRVGYRISQDGYYSTSGSVLVDGQQKRIVLDSPLRIYTPEELIDENVSLPLENLFFGTADFTLDQSSYGELDELAKFILAQQLCLEISGHTDKVGNEEDNQLLSQRRANSVRDYLIAKGIPASCLTAKGYGQSQPIGDNNTEMGRAKNRRVEVRFSRVD